MAARPGCQSKGPVQKPQYTGLAGLGPHIHVLEVVMTFMDGS